MITGKSLIKATILLAVAGLSAASCDKWTGGPDRAIGFKVKEVNATKSSPITTESIKNAPYGCFYSTAYEAGTDKVWYEAQTQTTYDSEKSIWGTGQFWPEDSKTALDFWSYGPVEAFEAAPQFNNAAKTMTFSYSPLHDASLRDDAKKQYDVIAAYTPKRKYNDSDSHAVPVTFKHALAGIRFKAGKIGDKEIAAEDKIRITSVELSGVKTNGKCTATYGEDVNFAWTFEAPVTKAIYTNIYEYEEGVYSVEGDYMDSKSNDWENMGDDIFMLIPQTLEGAEISIGWQKDGHTYTTRTSSLPNVKLDPGKIYTFTLDIKEREKQIVVIVSEIVPWEYVSSDIDYGHVVSNVKPIEFDETTATVSGENVFFKAGREIKAKFGLGSPAGASFFVSLKGDYDAFEVRYPDSERTDRYYADGDMRSVLNGKDCCFSIVPTVANPNREYQATVQICVRTSDGRIINVDDKVQDNKQYHIILSSN